MMKVSEWLAPWLTHCEFDMDIVGLAVDHRKVKPGYAFLAYEGRQENGLKYIQGAIHNGAVVIVIDHAWDGEECSVPVIPVMQLQSHLGSIASRFYGYPFQQLQVTGVTGTNGKTTVAYLLMQAKNLLGFKSAYIGTLGMGNLQQMRVTGLTTPGAVDLQGYGHELCLQGIQFLDLEVSSHALEQGRVAEIPFQQAIFTNLTHDHLDYHGSLENYAAAKQKLFLCTSLQSVIVNMDDPWHETMLSQVTAAKIYRFGHHEHADVRLVANHWSLHGMHLQCMTPWGEVNLRSSLMGDFNVANILAVFTSLMAQGFVLEEVIAVIAKLQAAPGRMQVVARKPLVIVDYAHTPDALEKVLQTLKKFRDLTQAGKLWVVFGCGGNRDPLKRPIMGKIAATIADVVVITSDNPRCEPAMAIIDEILVGIPSDFTAKIAIEDRRLAIVSVLQEAGENDMVLIAGKGHEEYQEIENQKNYFSDQCVVRDFFLME